MIRVSGSGGGYNRMRCERRPGVNDDFLWRETRATSGIVRRERRSEATSASGGPRRCRWVVAQDVSDAAAMTTRDASSSGCVCPRHGRWQRSRPLEARLVVVATTFRGTSDDGCSDRPWWHSKITISSDAMHRRVSPSNDHLWSDGLWGVLWSSSLEIILLRRTIWSMFMPSMIMFYAYYLHYLSFQWWFLRQWIWFLRLP
jgi:hypothetical protein